MPLGNRNDKRARPAHLSMTTKVTVSWQLSPTPRTPWRSQARTCDARRVTFASTLNPKKKRRGAESSSRIRPFAWKTKLILVWSRIRCKHPLRFQTFCQRTSLKYLHKIALSNFIFIIRWIPVDCELLVNCLWISAIGMIENERH